MRVVSRVGKSSAAPGRKVQGLRQGGWVGNDTKGVLKRVFCTGARCQSCTREQIMPLSISRLVPGNSEMLLFSGSCRRALASNHEEIVNRFYLGCLLRLFATIIVAESRAKSYVFAIRSCKVELIPSDHHESGAHKGRDGTSLPLFPEL